VKRQCERLWDLGSLPFYIGARPRPTNGRFPDHLPFAVGVEQETGVLVQMPSARVSEELAAVYNEGSQIGTPLAADGLGQRYLNDFLGFIEEALDGRLARARVLEIGCGTGALLESLSQRTARVVGIEPGVAAVAEARQRGLDIVNAPFTVGAFDERFDLVVHHGVLEHIEDPASFLVDQLQLLAPGGVIVLSVPDCTDALVRGDLSPLAHEHWSYFTHVSLARLAGTAGARVARLRSARVGGAIHAVLEPVAHNGAPLPAGLSASDFASRAQKSLRRLERYAKRIAERGDTLGLYPGGRFINYHALLQASLPPIRYFDDDPRLDGYYYPPIPIRVESRESLLAEPVDELLVTSWSFGAALAGDLRELDALRHTTVRTIGEILGPFSNEKRAAPLLDRKQ
jgi:SAM-dependent methyltransferase